MYVKTDFFKVAFNGLEPSSTCITKLGLLCIGGSTPGQLWEEQVHHFSALVYFNTWIRRGAERRGWEGGLLRHNYDLRNTVCSLRHVNSASEGVRFQKF